MADVALITGASGGLGAEFAKLFAADGHDLVLVARRRERLAALAADLGARHGVSAHVVVADLADPEGVAQVISEVDRLGLAITYLVNNAGFGSNGPFADADQARELAMVQVNDAAPLALTRALLPAMVHRRRGRILNIGSTAGSAWASLSRRLLWLPATAANSVAVVAREAYEAMMAGRARPAAGRTGSGCSCSGWPR